MKTRSFGILCIALLVCMLAACGASPQARVSRALGIDAAQGEVTAFTDTHGGFHGDGLTYAALQFQGDELPREMSQAAGWASLPLSGDLALLAYGGQAQGGLRSPLTGEDGQALFPPVENGYYYFEDRHPQSTDCRDASQLFARASLNFTLSIYDAQAQTLYYCEFDS